MRTTIRRMGNSQGVIIPKPLPAENGLTDEALPTIGSVAASQISPLFTI